MYRSNSLIIIPILVLCLILPARAQDDVTVIVPTTEAGENLDLGAVLDALKEAENLEAFEEALNKEGNEINNLDLNENGEVDYIRVLEESDGNTKVIVLQAVLGEEEYQDVATIEIEKKSDEDVTVQAVGNTELYGENYCVEPEPQTTTTTTTVTVVHVHTWPVIRLVFGPGYRPWRSPWGWGRHPVWWRPWRPVPISSYRSRHARRTGYRRTHNRRVRTSHMYKPRTSNRATHKTKRNQPQHTQVRKQQTRGAKTTGPSRSTKQKSKQQSKPRGRP